MNKRFRAIKKPIPIEFEEVKEEHDVETLEGTLHATTDDYIIHGINGEVYPIKKDIFYKTYNILEN